MKSEKATVRKLGFFERIAQVAVKVTGTSGAFIFAVLIVLVWILTGPIFGYSDTWQLVINTGTTIITFLMVFLIQRTQNKDSRALHLKLNELIASLEGPSNRLVDIEELDEQELETLANYYRKLAEMAKQEKHITRSHSMEVAERKHRAKYDNPDKLQS